MVGLSVASATDLDDDGFDDLVLSGSGNDAAGVGAGAVYVLYGGDDRLRGTVGLADADAKLVGAPGDVAGFRLDRAGDLDGDGSQGLVIGATAQPALGGSGVGSTYVFYGTEGRLSGTISLPATAARLVGEEPDDRPGSGSPGRATWTTTASTTWSSAPISRTRPGRVPERPISSTGARIV